MRNVVFGCLVLPLLVFSTGCGSKAKREAEDLMRESAEKSAAERDRQNKVVAEGDALWAGGEKKYDAAFEKYMVVVNASVPLMGTDALPKDVLARVYGRVIDVALDRRDNTALARGGGRQGGFARTSFRSPPARRPGRCWTPPARW